MITFEEAKAICYGSIKEEPTAAILEALITSNAVLSGLQCMAEIEVECGSIAWKNALGLINKQVAENRLAIAAWEGAMNS